MPKNKNILFVVAECQGFAAAGGLAEVAGSLPKAIMETKKFHKVSVMMPLYRSIIQKYGNKIKFLGSTEVTLSWRKLYCGVLKLRQDGVDYYFIDNKYFFDRDGIYGHFDDGERFAFFSKCIFDTFDIIGFVPEIIHTHDWHTALVNVYLDDYKRKGIYLNTKSIFTMHNIEYQGIYDFAILGDVFGLDNYYHDIIGYSGAINLVKGAIVTCDVLTTVSPTYAHEITTSEYAHGLESIINQNKHKLLGVINGINTVLYNPESDTVLDSTFTVDTLENKLINKQSLQKELGLNVDDKVCIISVISRLADHKGIDLIINKFDEIMKENVQFILLGTGDPNYENTFRYFEGKYPKRVKALIQFNLNMSKKIYGGSDLFLMPSKTEPCGLSQMIASRYGTVPIVRGTGGLFDTIKDYAGGKGNGFVFSDYNDWKMLEKIREAVSVYYKKEEYTELVKKVMQIDFSWNVSAKSYLDIYAQLLK